jgi:hypothetical protein
MYKHIKFSHLICIGLVCIGSTSCINQTAKKTTATQTSTAQTATVQTTTVQTTTAPTTSTQTNPVKVNPIKNIDAIEFLSFAESFSNMPADAQKQALNSTNQALAVNPNDLLHRMKLVMILGLPSSNLLDTPKAQQLLQKILQEDILGNSQLAFANLLFDHLVIANKIVKYSNGDPKKLDGIQQKNEALQLKLEATQQKLEMTQQKLDTAQQKLDELKKIEKSMSERDIAPKK